MFAEAGGPDIHYILFSDLCAYCDGLCKFGRDHHAVKNIPAAGPGDDGSAAGRPNQWWWCPVKMWPP